MANQTDDTDLAARFADAASALAAKEDTIISELNAAQGAPVDIGGYYNPDDELASRAMRPSSVLNEIIESI